MTPASELQFWLPERVDSRSLHSAQGVQNGLLVGKRFEVTAYVWCLHVWCFPGEARAEIWVEGKRVAVADARVRGAPHHDVAMSFAKFKRSLEQIAGDVYHLRDSAICTQSEPWLVVPYGSQVELVVSSPLVAGLALCYSVLG